LPKPRSGILKAETVASFDPTHLMNRLLLLSEASGDLKDRAAEWFVADVSDSGWNLWHWARESVVGTAEELNPLRPDDSLRKRAVQHVGRVARNRMNRYEGKTFESQHVVLDEGVFINCKFKNCSLEYSGGDVLVQNCHGEGCQLVWRGAAQRTVMLLQGLGMLAPPAPANPQAEPGRIQ
jgi:hypothetical protein